MILLGCGLMLAVSGCTSTAAERDGQPEQIERAESADANPNPSHLLVQAGDDAVAPMDEEGDAGAERDESDAGSGDAADAPAGTVARPTSNVRFYKELVDRGNATISDGYRLAYNLWKISSDDPEAAKQVMDFDGYRAALQGGGLVDSAWTGNADDPITHEEAAYLFAKAIDLQGGVWWSATGLARYAHREMVDRGLLPNRSGVQYISGPEIYSAFRDCKVFESNQE